MTPLRAFLCGTTILAGLAILADSAPAYDLNNKAHIGLHPRVPVTGSTLGRKQSVTLHADFRKLRKPAYVPRTLPPSLGAGANLRLKDSLNLGQANSNQATPSQAQKRRKASRHFRKPLLIVPPMQGPAIDLGLTPAGRKIETLRNKLGLESIAAVEGEGPAPAGGAASGGNPPAASGAAGLQDPGSEAGPADSASDCIGAAAEGLPNPGGNAATGPGRHVPAGRVDRLMRQIAEGAVWAPAVRTGSFNDDHGVWHGLSSEGHDTDIIQGSSGITIVVQNRDEATTTRYVYDRSGGSVKLNRTEIEYGPESSDPGTTETRYPDQSPGHGNTITHQNPPDSQPTEDASAGLACGEAAVRYEKQQAERNQPTGIRFRDPGPGGPSGMIVELSDPPTQEELDDMTCQPGADGDDGRAHNGGGRRPRRAQDFAQPGRDVDGSVVPGLSGGEATGDGAGEGLVDPRPGGDPDAAAGG